MKIAFDVHGVLDSLKEYRILMRELFNAKHTIYIISGQPLDKEMKEFLEEYHLHTCYHFYLSVEDYLMDRDVPYTQDGKGGKHFADEYWNHVKAEICTIHKVDMIFDDSPVYAEYFKNIPTVFSLVIDKTQSLTEFVRSRTVDERR